MNQAAQYLGYGFMVAAAGALLCGLLGLVFYLLGFSGQRVFVRLQRVYHLHVISYWLDRLEKGGVREFQKAEDEDKAYLTRKQGRV